METVLVEFSDNSEYYNSHENHDCCFVRREKKEYLQNLHTHTTYADGKDTPEEVILKAIEKGFYSIGFSEPSYMTYSKGFSGLVDKTLEYKAEVENLKEKYKDRIKIFCGLEVDMLSNPDMSGYDYLIGSAHYFKIGEEYVGFDRSAEEGVMICFNAAVVLSGAFPFMYSGFYVYLY